MINEQDRMIAVLESQKLDLALLNQIGQELASELHQRNLMPLLLQFGAALVRAPGALVWLNDRRKTGSLACQGAFQDGNFYAVDLTIKVGSGPVGQVAQTGKSKTISQIEEDAPFLTTINQALGASATSLILAPLKKAGGVIGVLGIIGDKGFSNYDQVLVETLGVTAAIAIHNAEQFSRLRRRRRVETYVSLNEKDFMASAEREFHRSQRYKRPLTAMAILIDRHVKTKEDVDPHGAERALLAVAQHLSDSLRVSDLYGKVDTSRLTLLLTETTIDGAAQLAKKLKTSIEELSGQTEQLDLPLSVRIGMAEMTEETPTFQTLLDAAGEALNP